MAPLEAAEKRLLLALLHHPRVIRESGLLLAIAELLPGACEPLMFTVFPAQLQVSHGGARISKQPSDRWGKYRTAVCTGAPMTSGLHYAEFRLIERSGWVRVGVVNVELDSSTAGRPGAVASSAGSDGSSEQYHNACAFDALGGGSATASSVGWGYNAALGSCWHNSGFSDWAGQRVAGSGDVIGLLLDVNHGCLDVFLNGERLGRMVDHSVRLASVAVVTSVRSALCWMVELHDTADQVEIEGKQPPQLG